MYVRYNDPIYQSCEHIYNSSSQNLGYGGSNDKTMGLCQ